MIHSYVATRQFVFTAVMNRKVRKKITQGYKRFFLKQMLTFVIIDHFVFDRIYF